MLLVSHKNMKKQQRNRENEGGVSFAFFFVFFSIKHTDSYVPLIIQTESSEPDIFEYLTIQKGGEHPAAVKCIRILLGYFYLF